MLKKKGLVSKRIDARKQKMTRYMKDKVKTYAGVIEGKEAVVWREPKIYEQYKAAGFKTASAGRTKKAVIVPKEQEQAMRKNKNELMTVQTDIGNVTVEKVILPVGAGNMDAFLRQAMTHPETIDGLKRPDQLWGFTYYGHRSVTTYDTIEHVAEDLSKYRTIEDQDTWDNFVLVSIHERDSYSWRARSYGRRGKNKTVQDRRLQTFRFVKKTEEEKAEDHRRQERERYQRLKAQQTETDKARERERWKQKKRSQRGGLKRTPRRT